MAVRKPPGGTRGASAPPRLITTVVTSVGARSGERRTTAVARFDELAR